MKKIINAVKALWNKVVWEYHMYSYNQTVNSNGLTPKEEKKLERLDNFSLGNWVGLIVSNFLALIVALIFVNRFPHFNSQVRGWLYIIATTGALFNYVAMLVYHLNRKLYIKWFIKNDLLASLFV